MKYKGRDIETYVDFSGEVWLRFGSNASLFGHMQEYIGDPLYDWALKSSWEAAMHEVYGSDLDRFVVENYDEIYALWKEEQLKAKL